MRVGGTEDSESRGWLAGREGWSLLLLESGALDYRGWSGVVQTPCADL
jgi:hypothetical protein